MKSLHFLSLLFLLVLFSCQDNANQKEADYLNRALSDSTSVTGLTGDSVKLVKTAGIEFKVKDVEKTVRTISELAQKHGGAIYHQNFRSSQTDSKELKISDDSLLVISAVLPQADLTVRVPSEKLETFLYAVADLGYFTNSAELKIDDQSLLYLQNALRQKARNEAVTGQRRPDSNTTTKTLQVKDEAIGQYIANKAIDADVAYSTVHLSLTQNAVVKKERIANYILSDYELSFNNRLGLAFEKGWEAFLNFIVALTHLWMFFITGAVLYFLYRLYSRYKWIS